jgi:dihydroorotate dehydrogenase
MLTRIDPERAHDWGLAALNWVQPLWRPLRASASLQVNCLGFEFAHPLGLAAGFDKNGDHLDALGAIGFSHVELGTVTPRPQPGNPKPRMFRIRASGALVNRMGFNNKGAEHLVGRLAQSRYAGVRGISIGKNADTPLENAAADYVACLRQVYAAADYVAVNVSSPNTARLRELQGRDGLERIVGALAEERARLEARHGKHVPLLVKIAPNLDAEQISTLAATLRALPVQGIIATNTSTDLSSLGTAWPVEHRGGLSGAPLHPLSVAVIGQLRAEMGPRFPLIGVGGITDAATALATLNAGADLIQVYTGFAYRGPRLVEDILDALERQRAGAGPAPSQRPLHGGSTS